MASPESTDPTAIREEDSDLQESSVMAPLESETHLESNGGTERISQSMTALSVSDQPNPPPTSNIPKQDHLRVFIGTGNETADGGDATEGTRINENAMQPTEGLGEGNGKAKRKRKPKSKSAKKAGTGFEEYYVDVPITPADYEEEKEMYHESIPFAQRIETAIQRFAAKRNMDSLRKNIFDKYLRSGGVQGGPKQFSGGLDPRNLDDHDAEGIARLAATHFVPIDPSSPRSAHFVVDFEECLKSFLSYNLPLNFDLGKDVELEHPHEIKLAVGVILNFLNYLLYHDVCPEYQDQIDASKAICRLAERELWAIELVKGDLPGDFNRACSRLFGGIFATDLSHDMGNAEWDNAFDSQGTRALRPQLTSKAFKVGLVANADSRTFALYEALSKAGSIQVTSVKELQLVITEIIPSTLEIQTLYHRDIAKGLKPLGILKAKTWHGPCVINDDLTVEEEAEMEGSELAPIEIYEFWVEDHVLRNCFIGLKMEATVRELNIGIKYFDAVSGIYCSFFRVVANELTDGWKEPEDKWLPRREPGGSSVSDDSSPSDRV